MEQWRVLSRFQVLSLISYFCVTEISKIPHIWLESFTNLEQRGNDLGLWAAF